MKGGRRSRPPQICDGLIGPSFSDFGLAFRLHMLLGSLEDSDLRLKLVIVTLQCLLLAGGLLLVTI